ncbi:MAG TPA: amino acid adenylation domain-containing protein, partial [Blastocatellia bacterium]
CVERSPDMLAGLLGILKAGGAYLPLDPNHPRERLAFMMDDSRVQVLVTQSWLNDLFSGNDMALVRLDDDRPSIEAERPEPPEVNVEPEHLAYVIYTSGSTGKPKGIMITHGNLANYTGWVSDYMFDDTAEVVPAVQTLGFDGSLKQLFAPLARGIGVWLFSSDQTAEPAALVKALSSRKNLKFSCVPSLWRAILECVESGQAILPAGCITSVFVGGEALTKNLVDRTFNLLPDLRLYNFYGPTETTATACATQITPGDKITIGRPIAGKRSYILGPQLEPVPVGVPGELYIGGEGLAWGYLNRPDLTAENFIADPFSREPGARIYRTRDLARYLEDGRIEFLGRSDYQVKVRGFRIELGEIESVLAEHPSVHDAIVAAREDAPGNYRLVAYVVTGNAQPATASELRAFLRRKLPDYMVPFAFVFLDAIPLTATGKVDRNKLPAPQQARPELEQSYVPPRNALEEVIASVWSQLLSIERIGINDNFFDLGGHSLLATQAISRVREAFQIKLPLRKMFEQPTVAGLSQAILDDEDQRERVEQTASLLMTLSHLSDEEAALMLQEQGLSDGEGN